MLVNEVVATAGASAEPSAIVGGVLPASRSGESVVGVDGTALVTAFAPLGRVGPEGEPLVQVSLGAPAYLAHPGAAQE